MDKLRAMQVFLQIAEQGSLTAAAAALHTSLPAVVRSLAALETELGVRLFNRTTRRIALTEEGRVYLESARHVIAAVAEAESALRAEAAEPSGQLIVTAPVLFGQMYVAPAVTRFVQRYAKLNVKVELLDRVVNLLEEGLDVGVRIGQLQDSTLVAQPLTSVRRVVVASPRYLRRHGLPAHPKDLSRANCVLFSGASGSGWTFHEGSRKFNVAVSGNLQFNHNAPAVEACVADLGFGRFLSYQVAPHLARKELRCVLEAFEPPATPVSVVYPHARLLPTRTRLFVEWIKQALRGMKF